jgi:glycine cleavage system aminomethyltransferase T
MPATAALKSTCLNAAHRAMSAKMVDFGGWDMPVQYSSLVEEHLAVRRSVGAFDVSHMGEIDITGPEALQLTDYVTTNAAGRLKTGQIHYSGLLYVHGGFVDDVLVHQVADDHYFLCVNASSQEKDFDHIRAPRARRSACCWRVGLFTRAFRGVRRRQAAAVCVPRHRRTLRANDHLYTDRPAFTGRAEENPRGACVGRV